MPPPPGPAAACVGGVVVLHRQRPHLNPLHVLNEYAKGPLGVAMTAAFYAVGVTRAALGWRLRHALRWSRVTTAAPPLLMAAGVVLTARGVQTIAFGRQ